MVCFPFVPATAKQMAVLVMVVLVSDRHSGEINCYVGLEAVQNLILTRVDV